jgi:hypothetical protein
MGSKQVAHACGPVCTQIVAKRSGSAHPPPELPPMFRVRDRDIVSCDCCDGERGNRIGVSVA